MESLLQDIRYAWRALRKSPRFAAFAIPTLAVGIGANTGILSFRHYAIILRLIPQDLPKPTDPLSLLFVGVVLLVCAPAASFAPACRAAKVDPMVALRYE